MLKNRKTNRDESKKAARNGVMFEALEDRLMMAVTQATALTTINGPATGARAGISMSSVSNNSLVGAYMAANGTTANAGKVIMYSGTTSTILKTFAAPTATANGYFGASVAGTTDGFVIIGETGSNGNAGRVYFYNASSGSLVCTINNPTPASGDSFGCSVAQVGNNILVGAKGDDNNSLTDSGAAYLFNRSGTLLATYINPTKAASTYFGNAVTCAANNPIVAAFYNNTGATRSGQVYEFDATKTGTVTTAKFTFKATTSVADDHFGISVSGNGTNLLIGADGRDNGSVLNTGAAFLFNASTGAAIRTIANPANVANDNFGNSVALSSTKILVGAQGNDTYAANSGAAFLFDVGTGTLTHTFYNPKKGASDNFGSSVSFLGTNVVIGAQGADMVGTDSGAAYVFKPQ